MIDHVKAEVYFIRYCDLERLVEEVWGHKWNCLLDQERHGENVSLVWRVFRGLTWYEGEQELWEEFLATGQQLDEYGLARNPFLLYLILSKLCDLGYIEEGTYVIQFWLPKSGQNKNRL